MGKGRPCPGQTPSQAPHLPPHGFRPRAAFMAEGGFHPGITAHFPALPPGLLGAPPAMPLLNGPALSTALLQLALQTQGQKVTWVWALGSLLTHTCCHSPFPFSFKHSHLGLAFGVVRHLAVSLVLNMGPNLSQVLRTRLGKKDLVPSGNRMAFHPYSHTKTQK